MFRVKRNCRKALTTLLMLLVFCVSAVMGVSAEEEAAETFKLAFMLNGEVFEEQEYKAGDIVTAPEAPEKENFIFTEWKNLPETMPEADQTVTAAYVFDGALVTDLENVYECELVVSEDLAVTMYLRIDAEGNFVFSRSTDFSQTEKGAGKVYRKSEEADIAGGEYAVDISWSPMVGMFEPVLLVNAEDMTFELYGAADPSTSKGNGTIAYTDGVYTLNLTNGNTTSFTYEDGVITFTSKLWYGSASFDRTDDAGEFVSYTAELENGTEDTADEMDLTDGASEVTEAEGVEENAAADEDTVLKVAPGEYCFVYYVVNDEAAALGEYVSTFEVKENGNILLTSPFWFGATTPRFVAEDGTVTYPEFIISGKAIEKDIDTTTILSKADVAEAENTADTVEEDGDSTEFKTGTYGGTHTTTAMGSSLTYSITITFNADGTYNYTVKFNMMGQTYTESESGTYKVNGSSLTLTSSDGKTMSGTVNGNSVSITRLVSSFSFSPATITLTYGSTPGVIASNATTGDNDSSSDNSKETEKESDSDSNKETENQGSTPVVGDGGITGGAYNVDISWSPMGAMFSPVLDIDAENMTFHIYNAGTPGTSKGSGTVTYKNGVYTLNYDNGNTTTFTYKDNVITFTSKLWYGAASFNNEDANGNFVSYTATLGKSQTSDSVTETEKETETESEQQPESEAEKVPETDSTETVTLKTGTYGGKCSTTAMGSTIVYTYSMTLNEDGTYSYTVKFNMMGTDYENNETGTYILDGTTLTLTNSDGTAMSGTVNSDGTVTVTRKISSFAFSDMDVVFTYGYTADETPGETETEQPEKNETEESENPEETGSLASGAYNVDISWSAMAAMFSPVLDIDAENMTFNVYNASTPETSKGSGNISYENGVYTLNYENGNTTTFTYADGVISFTSKLWYGTASFNSDEGNGFVTYTAKVGGSTVPDETEESESEKTESETPNETVIVQTGVYSGTYETTAMGSTVTYYYTLTVNADYTYAYTVEFNMMDNNYQEAESGIYTVEGNRLTLTRSDDSYVMYGTVNGDGTLSVTRRVSSFAASEVTINFTYGTSAVLLASVPETITLLFSEKKEQTASDEESTETDTEAVTEPESSVKTETATESEESQTETAVGIESESEADAEKSTEEAVSEKETEVENEETSSELETKEEEASSEIETEVKKEETSSETETEVKKEEASSETETEAKKEEASSETETEANKEEVSSETEKETQKVTVTEKISETVAETKPAAETSTEVSTEAKTAEDAE